MQNEQLHFSKRVQHVSEYIQPSVLILQHLLGTTDISLEVSRPHTLDLGCAGTETLTLILSFCEEVSICDTVRLHLLNRSCCSRHS
jgi:hypothetical protein